MVGLVALVILMFKVSIGCAAPSGTDDSDRLYIMLYDHTDWHGGRYPMDHLWDRFIQPMHIDVISKYPNVKIGNQYGGAFYEFWSSQENSVLYERWMKFLEHLADERVSIVGGTYSQSVSAFLHEEAAIRQFVYGLDSIRSTTEKDVKIYAFSENTGWSYLPQILNDFGFEGALVRVHYAPYGFPPTYNASIGYWEGPDGSRIPMIPTYDGDNLKSTFAGMNRGEAEFVAWINVHKQFPPMPRRLDNLNRYYNDKKAQGIEYVVISVIEDTHFDAHLDILVPEIQEADPEGKMYKFITAQEAFEIIPMPDEPPIFRPLPREWSFSWNAGYYGNTMTVWANEVSTLLTDTEKLIAFRYLADRNSIQDYQEELDVAWKKLLIAEAHDAYSVQELTTISFQQLFDAKRTVWPLRQNVLSELSQSIKTNHIGQSIVVYNTLNFDRKEPVILELLLDEGKQIASIKEAASGDTVPFDVISVTAASGGRNRAEVVFIADVPSMGHNTYNVILEDGIQRTTLCEPDILSGGKGQIVLGNEYCTILFNENGEIESLLAFDGTPILSSGTVQPSHYFTANVYPLDKPHLGGIYRSEGKISAIEEGSVLTRIRVEGTLEEQLYWYAVTLYDGLPYVDFRTDFKFAGNKGIGHPPEHNAEIWGETDSNSRRKRLTMNLHPAFQLAQGSDVEESTSGLLKLWNFVRQLGRGSEEISPWSERYPLYDAAEYNRVVNISRYTPFYPEDYGRYSSLKTLESWPDKMYNHIYDLESRYWLDISDTDGTRGFLLLNKGTAAYVYDGNLLSMVLTQGDKFVPLNVGIFGLRSGFNMGRVEDGHYLWDYRIIPHLKKENNTIYQVTEDHVIDSHRQGLTFNNPLLVYVVDVTDDAQGGLEPKFQYLTLPTEGQLILSALKLIDNSLYLRVYEYGGKTLHDFEVNSPLYSHIEPEPVTMDFRRERAVSNDGIAPYHIGSYRLGMEE